MDRNVSIFVTLKQIILNIFVHQFCFIFWNMTVLKYSIEIICLCEKKNYYRNFDRDVFALFM